MLRISPMLHLARSRRAVEEEPEPELPPPPGNGEGGDDGDDEQAPETRVSNARNPPKK